MPASQELLTFEEYAKRRGISREGVRQGIKRYKIPTTGGYPDRVDPRVADALWREGAKIAPRSGKPGDSAHPTAQDDVTGARGDLDELDAARLRKELALAELAEIKIKQQRGRLVDVELAAKLWHRVVRQTRERVLGVAVRVAPEVVALGDHRAVQRELERELRSALEALSLDLAKLAEADNLEADE